MCEYSSLTQSPQCVRLGVHVPVSVCQYVFPMSEFLHAPSSVTVRPSLAMFLPGAISFHFVGLSPLWCGVLHFTLFTTTATYFASLNHDSLPRLQNLNMAIMISSITVLFSSVHLALESKFRTSRCQPNLVSHHQC